MGLSVVGCGAAPHADLEYPSNPGAIETHAPDVTNPGPDFGFIPNSAQVVPPGRAYLETALESTRFEDLRTTFVPTLVRFGLLDDLELRAMMNVVSHESDSSGDSTGYGPPELGFKYRFDRGGQGFLQPSWGVEGELVLPIGSAGMEPEKLEPSISLNVDHVLTRCATLTWNLGVSAPVDDDGHQYAQAFFAAAGTQWIADSLQVYVDGAARSPSSSSDDGLIVGLGAGLYFYVSERIVLFAGASWGLTGESPDSNVLVGTTVAF